MPLNSVALDKARSNRRASSPAEKKLWQCLRGGKVHGLKFRRQHVLDQFILDFYCAAARVAVEVDGRTHDFIAEQDRIRDERLAELQVLVVRVTNQDVLRNPQGVAEYIGAVCLARIESA